MKGRYKWLDTHSTQISLLSCVIEGGILMSNTISNKYKLILGIVLLSLVLILGSCRNETQNRLRRNIQDFTGQKMFITLYALDGKEIYNGQVNGKVTRSSSKLSDGGAAAGGHYIFWYDEKSVYHQTDLPYLLTSRPRDPATGTLTGGSINE